MSNSMVLDEFFRIINKGELTKTAYPKNPYQEKKTTIEEKRLPDPDKSIIEKAHPKSIYVAESRGDGGLVENQIEQHDKIMHVINKMPTGALFGTYAAIVPELIKIAEKLDESEKTEAADEVMRVAKTIVAELEKYPF